jgi:formylglycine-generating enzyme required for sulfatase activity
LGITKPASPGSDIFSIGNILYELLVGKPAKGTYLPPSQIRSNLSSEVDGIINYALNYHPEDRYTSAKDMSDHIRRSVGDFIVRAPESNNRIAIFALSAAVVVLLCFVGYLQFIQGQPSEKEKLFAQTEKQDEQLLQEIKEKFTPPEAKEVASMNAKVKAMRYIPAGPVVIGIFKREYEYKLTKRLFTDVSAHIENVGHFYIDRFEYPNKLPVKGEKPEFLSQVTQEEAGKLCAKEGKRLCSAVEWEKACRGVNNYIYSYGDTQDGEYCNKENYEKNCQSDYGVYGMSSDAAEWTSSISPTSTKEAVIKGGDVGGVPERRYRCSNTVSKSKDYRNRLISFRCCKDVDLVLVEEEQKAQEELLRQAEEAAKEAEEAEK